MQLQRFVGFIFLLGSAALLADDKNDAAPILCRGHYHSEEQAIEQLARISVFEAASHVSVHGPASWSGLKGSV